MKSTRTRNRFIFLGAVVLMSAGCRDSQRLPEPSHQISAPPVASTPAPLPAAAIKTETRSAAEATSTVQFTGEVSRGQAFVKAIPSKMLFRMNSYAASDSGWRIEILPDTAPPPEDFDCSGSVTGPAHGPNPLFLDKPDGTTPEKTLQWSPHEFSFVTDPSQCKLAWDLNNVVEYPSNASDKEKDDAGDKLSHIATGTGTLTVIDAKLGPSTAADEFGPILWLKFEVVLQFPPRSTSQH